MKRIALLAQNEPEAASASLIARQLGHEGWGVAELLSLDRFFEQHAQRIFEGSGIDVRVVEPRRPLRAPFYRLPAWSRLAVVLANQAALASLAGSYDAVVVGCDGALERVVVNSMKRLGRPTYLVISGLSFARSEGALKTGMRRLLTRLRLNHLFFSELGQGMCHRVFVPGEHSRRELVKLGVPDERIEVTGSPRFARLIPASHDPEKQILDRLGEAGPIRMVYLMGAWEWHGLHDELDREMAQIRLCAETAHRWPGRFELAIRLHPRSTPGERERLEAIPGISVLSAERPLPEELRQAHVVLAAASTGLVEAIALGRLVLAVHLSGFGQAVTPRAFEEAGMWVVSDPEALRQAFAELLSPGQALARRVRLEAESLWHFLARTSHLASQRIVDRIRADLGA